MRSTAAGAALIAQGLFTAFFPSDCRLCSAPLTNISRLPVCPGCLLAIVPLWGPACEVCGETVFDVSISQNQICAACQESRPHFAKAAAYGAYDGPLRELIHLLKYERVEPVAGVLGQKLAQAIPKLGPMADSVLVVPVPLYRSKRRDRGFNQAELIARAALKDCAGRWELRADVLERTRPTVSQIGLTRAERMENVRDAFQVRHLNRVAGREALLVDDVLTTGTTASECARVLRNAGAAKVWVATVARTLKEDDFESEKTRPQGATIAKAS